MGAAETTFWMLLIYYLIVWFCVTQAFVDVAKEKGWASKSSTIWLISFFATLIVAGHYTISLPDRAGRIAGTSPVVTDDELPSL